MRTLGKVENCSPFCSLSGVRQSPACFVSSLVTVCFCFFPSFRFFSSQRWLSFLFHFFLLLFFFLFLSFTACCQFVYSVRLLLISNIIFSFLGVFTVHSATAMASTDQQKKDTDTVGSSTGMFKPTGDSVDVFWKWNSLKDKNNRM